MKILLVATLGKSNFIILLAATLGKSVRDNQTNMIRFVHLVSDGKSNHIYQLSIINYQLSLRQQRI